VRWGTEEHLGSRTKKYELTKHPNGRNAWLAIDDITGKSLLIQLFIDHTWKNG